MSNEKSYIHEILSENYLLKKRDINNMNLLDHFRLLATNRFKWIDLPNNIQSYHVESFLYDHGEVAFYDDDLLGMICLPATVGGNLNIYNDPVALNLKGINYSKTINIDDLIRLKANDLSKPLVTYVNYYVYLLTLIDQISYQNLKQQRFPYIIGANKNNELTLKRIFEDLEDGKEAIICDEKLNMATDPSIKVLKTEAPFLLDKLRQEKNEVKAELYTLLGINNSITNKKERLLVDEINVNNGQILMNLELEYKHRKKACEELNKKYGYNVKVEKVIDQLSIDFLGSNDPGNKKDPDNNSGGDPNDTK